jgi:two-component system chemotaxis response regulator CheB
MNRKIRVLVVDDSALVRKALTDSLSKASDIEVVGTAVDPFVAKDRIMTLSPDVLTLDIEMPRMDGLTFLKLLMQRRPMPVVILSSLTGSGSAKALEALRAGAVEVLQKPAGPLSAFEDQHRLAEVIRAAAGARISQPLNGEKPENANPPPKPQPCPAPLAARPPAPAVPLARVDPRRVILMGASTGGTEALRAILTSLPGELPGIAIVQHIPAQFSLAFAQRLNELCAFEVREAKNGDRLSPGLALVAPGGFHMLLEWRGAGYEVRLTEGPRVHYQRPAVDVLFSSAVKAGAAPHSLAVLLTGMGADGAVSMLEMRKAGGRTIAQDEASCVVYGMPREAARLGAAETILPLSQIASRVERFGREGAAFRA